MQMDLPVFLVDLLLLPLVSIQSLINNRTMDIIILQSIGCTDAHILFISKGEILENSVNDEKGIRSL